jgi:hypothetical protein
MNSVFFFALFAVTYLAWQVHFYTIIIPISETFDADFFPKIPIFAINSLELSKLLKISCFIDIFS